MFNTKKIESLEIRIEGLETGYQSLLEENLQLRGESVNNETRIDIRQLETRNIQTMQQRILDFIGVELKTTEAKTELVKKLK